MIRKAAEQDAGACRKLVEILENRSFAEKEFNEIYDFQLKDGLHTCWIYEIDGAVIGMLNMKIESHLHHERPVAAILEFVIEPAYRGNGYGDSLFTHACEYAYAQGCEQIELETSLWRKDAHRFYEKHGMIADHLYYTKKPVM